MEEDYFPRRSPTLLQGGHVGFVFFFFWGVGVKLKYSSLGQIH